MRSCVKSRHQDPNQPTLRTTLKVRNPRRERRKVSVNASNTTKEIRCSMCQRRLRASDMQKIPGITELDKMNRYEKPEFVC